MAWQSSIQKETNNQPSMGPWCGLKPLGYAHSEGAATMQVPSIMPGTGSAGDTGSVGMRVTADSFVSSSSWMLCD